MQGRFNENMYKEINELDRMTIGVREWAIERALQCLRDELIERVHDEGKPMTVLGMAKLLEEFVLRGIPQELRGFMPDKTSPPRWETAKD